MHPTRSSAPLIIEEVRGLMISTVGLWDVRFPGKWLFSIAAAMVGGIVATVEGGLLYLFTRQRLAFSDYRRIALVCVFGGTTAAFFGSLIAEDVGVALGAVSAPLIMFTATCMMLGRKAPGVGG